ncbi:hypothetical protein BKA82DRAFT_4073162 [Pisolithus tinctorius]|nr:hypothetical protein BKA82DRAFT_4073162 [Pisolithus tinctorius]
MKVEPQVAMTSSNISPVTHFDVEHLIRNVAFETLKTMPTRLLYMHTGVLCNRHAQLTQFMNSQQYKRLVSQCTTCDPDQRMKLVDTAILKYFQFVMLSHRWGEDEPSLRDIEGHLIYDMSAKEGFKKLQAFCLVAFKRDFLWAWSDTCCIDKDSSAELQEAIGSMFVWYRQSSLTIAYLSDVPATGSLQNSEWFRRGWTLQELLAPGTVLFYTQNWSLYKNLTSSNHKTDKVVLEELEGASGIESQFLTRFSPGTDDARSRLQWASLRRTTRPEDIAYSLFGIFNLHLPVLYGEPAEKALGRLLAEIISQSGDISVLDWVGEASPFHSCFPAHITSYQILPLPPAQLKADQQSSTMNSYAPRGVYDFHSLTRVPLPRFLNRRLILPCIAHFVTVVLLKGSDPSAPSYMYSIQAFGLRPLEITLPNKLEDETRSRGSLQLVRPWHSKFPGSSAELDAVTEDTLLSTLERPFNALLLSQLPHDEHKRIVSSTRITAHPIDRASILKSKIRIFNIV